MSQPTALTFERCCATCGSRTTILSDDAAFAWARGFGRTDEGGRS
jgi:hypothetical protein